MHRSLRVAYCVIAWTLPLLAVTPLIPSAFAQTSLTPAITYQGALGTTGSPYTGTADFKVSLFDALTGGAQVGATLTRSTVAVAAGVFTLADLDFGAASFTAGGGQNRWLRIEVRTPHDATDTLPYTTLDPRQPLTSAPFANWAAAAGTANAAGAAGLLFPDGTRQVTAAAGSSTPQPLVTYPANSTFTVTFAGVACRMDTPLNSGYTIPPATTTTPNPSPLFSDRTIEPLTLSRPRTTDNTWLNLWNSVVAGGWTGSGQNLVIARTQTGPAATWTVTKRFLQIAGYRLEPIPGSLSLHEVITVVQADPAAPTSLTLVQTGATFNSGILSQTSDLTATLSGTTLRLVQLAAFTRTAQWNTMSTSSTFECADYALVTLRAPFGCNPELSAFYDLIDNSITNSTRRTLTIGAGAAGGGTVYTSAAQAFVATYRVVQAADGSLYEEYDVLAPNQP